MAKKKELRNIANQIIRYLDSAGIKLQYYESMTTSSIYIKCDYGLCNSIRISDHNGKKHLKYRYNVSTHISEFREETTPEGFKRAYYPIKQICSMINHILKQRHRKVTYAGEEAYQQQMVQCKEQNKNHRGFWSQSRELN